MKQKYKVYINNETNIVTENWIDFCSKYKVIEAAGGLVFNEKNKILMIFRNGKWDLPKGKIELGESIEDAAIREVEEECGIDNLKIDNKLINTYHTYNLNGFNILKKTWFRLHLKILKMRYLEWCIIKYLKNYGNIKDVIMSI